MRIHGKVIQLLHVSHDDQEVQQGFARQAEAAAWRYRRIDFAQYSRISYCDFRSYGGWPQSDLCKSTIYSRLAFSMYFWICPSIVVINFIVLLYFR